jgi:predicted transcriptional regulator
LCDKISNPFAIATYKKGGYRLFLDLKINDNWTVAGVDVRHIGKDIAVNAVTTVFGRKNAKNDTVFWKSPEITSEQEAFLNGHDFHQYPPVQEANTSLSDTSAEMSSGNETEASQTLFQLTREGELEAAREAIADGRGREEFTADQTAFSEAMDEAMPDGVTDGDGAAAWLGAIYDEAAGTGEGKLTTTETDEKFEYDLRNNRKMFTNFMELAGATLKYVPGDEDERNLRAEIEDISKSGKKSGGYTLFETSAWRAINGKEIKGSTRQSLITYMSNDMTRFRDLYVRITGDAEYIRLAENEIYEDFETGIKDRERMTPYELGGAKAKIRDRVLRDRITEGTATDRDYQRVIEEAGRVTRELKAETAALEKNADALEEKLSDMAHDYARQMRILREKEDALVQARKEARRSEEKIWTQARDTVTALEKEISDRNTKVKKLAGALTTADRKAADTGSDFGLGIVGKSTLGYITWNTLSGMKQVPQSFTPFLAKVNPGHLAASALKYISSSSIQPIHYHQHPPPQKNYSYHIKSTTRHG